MTSLTATLVFSVLVSFSYQALITEEAAKKARVDCLKETGVTEELIEKAENGEFADDKNFKCFTKCFYQQLGYVNDAGEAQIEIIKENLPEALREKGGQAIEKCKTSKGSDPCGNAFELHKCYVEQIHADL